MKNYLIRRLLQLIPVFIGVLFILFFILDKAPGSPASTMMDPKMTAEQKALLNERLDPDKPFYEKFFNWVLEAGKGNFGYSNKYKRPVTQVIGAYIVPTFRLSIVALFISLLIGIPIGIVSATRQNSLLDHSMTAISLIGISMPTFFFGLLLLKLFAVDLQWFPLYGAQNHMLKSKGAWVVFWDVVRHLVLPSIVLGLSSTASFMRYTRSSMLEVIRQDYIRTARAKGLAEKVVIYRHAFRNAVIPIITLLGFSIPGLVSGAVMTESIFGYPGLGKISVDAVNARDYPLILGINSMLSILTLVSTLVADIFYAVADPRIKYE
ncbi:MAG: ABC transporter permease [Christensenellales bacterium]|jgi:peptide/nickel transport system permease protein